METKCKRRFLYILWAITLAWTPPAHALDKQAMLADSIHARRLRVPMAAPGMAPSAVSVPNSGDYIEAVLEDNGRFTIGTVEGDPGVTTDNNKKLLFGHPSPSTSDTMVNIDGTPSSIHGGTSSGATASGDSLSVTLTVGEIEILETLTITTSQATGRKDTVQIYFKVTNIGAGSHDVSLRTQLDTQLGDNDGAPFRIPGVGGVTTDLEFDNDAGTLSIADIPAQSLVLDSLTSPSVISLLTFRDLGYTTPDRVVFGYWPVSVGAWDYTTDPTRSFTTDSSVIVWWGYPDANAFTLASGETKEFAILYGIGNCTLQGTNPFTILFCGPATLQGQASGASYTYTPVNMTAFLTNNSGAIASGGVARLNFTPDFALSSGYTQSRAIEESVGLGAVTAGQTAQIDWQLTSNGRQIGTRIISLSVDANGNHSSVTREITTESIANLLYGLATDEEGNPIAGATITVLSGETVVGVATTQSDGTYAVQGLSPGTYTVRLSVSGRPDTYTTATVTDGSSSAVTGNPSSFSTGSDLQAFVYPNPVREGRAHITYYTEAATSVEVQIFTTSGGLIRTLSDSAAGAGWHTVDWTIDDVANGVYFYQVKAGSSRTHGKIAVLKRRGL